MKLEIKRVRRDCPWMEWQVIVQVHIKYVGRMDVPRPRRMIVKTFCSHAARCRKRCRYNGKGMQAPFAVENYI